MIGRIEQTRLAFADELNQVCSLQALTSVRDKYLGRKKGVITLLMKDL